MDFIPAIQWTSIYRSAGGGRGPHSRIGEFHQSNELLKGHITNAVIVQKFSSFLRRIVYNAFDLNFKKS